MYITDYVDNTKYGQSSVMDFAGYLEKESLVQEQLGNATSRQLSAYLDKQNDSVRVEGREYFFNGRGSTFDCEDVTKAIDANVKGLKKKEARYYTFSLSPSGEEIAHLRRTIADTRQALSDAGEVVPADLEDTLMRTYLKEFIRRSRNCGSVLLRITRRRSLVRLQRWSGNLSVKTRFVRAGARRSFIR